MRQESECKWIERWAQEAPLGESGSKTGGKRKLIQEIFIRMLLLQASGAQIHGKGVVVLWKTAWNMLPSEFSHLQGRKLENLSSNSHSHWLNIVPKVNNS